MLGRRARGLTLDLPVPKRENRLYRDTGELLVLDNSMMDGVQVHKYVWLTVQVDDKCWDVAFAIYRFQGERSD